MIFGIGTDIVETERIAKALKRHGDRFVDFILTDREREVGKQRSEFIQFLAGRWAAKEAVAKALGCGLGAKCAWRDIEILHAPSGAPQAALSGCGRVTMDSLGIVRIHVSISHEHSCAAAFAVAEMK